MTEHLAAADVTDDHVGRRITYMPNRLPETLLAVDHGGPFTVPENLPDIHPTWFPDRKVSPHFTVQLQVQHPDREREDPLYVWLIPEAAVTVT